jgi:hypothetical protein
MLLYLDPLSVSRNAGSGTHGSSTSSEPSKGLSIPKFAFQRKDSARALALGRSVGSLEDMWDRAVSECFEGQLMSIQACASAYRRWVNAGPAELTNYHPPAPVASDPHRPCHKLKQNNYIALEWDERTSRNC